MKVALVGNTDFAIYNYRFELCLKLLERGDEVVVISPKGNYTKLMVDSGCKHIPIDVNAHGTNPFQDLKLKRVLKGIFKLEKPDFVCGYTIKPNIYGAWACKELNIPFIANITGLGPSVENPGIIQAISILLYRIAFKNIRIVFCQNEANRKFFVEHKIVPKERTCLIPGSGINLKKFKYYDYPVDKVIRFVFVSRIRKDKGIDQFIDAARYITQKYKNTEFHICGNYDKEYEWVENEKSIIYHGMVRDMTSILPSMNCLIFPSYYAEGLANVLLEASATGRPIMTTNRPGCKETIEDCSNGYLIKEKDSADLIEKIELFLSLDNESQRQFGISGRLKVEREFDRNIVISRYLEELKHE